MSLTILYRNPARPHEACMAMIMGQNAEAMMNHLEDQGFVIDKITFAPSAKSVQAEHSADVARERLSQSSVYGRLVLVSKPRRMSAHLFQEVVHCG